MSDDIFRDIWEKLAEIYQRIGSVAQTAAGAGGGGQGGGGIGSVFSKFASAAGKSAQGMSRHVVQGMLAFAKIAGVVTIVVSAFTLLIKTVYNTVKAQIEQQREYSKMNAALARNFAINDIRDFFRDMKYAAGTSESTSALNDAFSELKDALLPLKTLWTNVVNVILIFLTKMLTPIVRGIDMLVKLWIKFNTEFSLMFGMLGVLLDPARLFRDDKKREAERREQERKDAEKNQLPIVALLRNILAQNWAAVTDTRKPLFGVP